MYPQDGTLIHTRTHIHTRARARERKRSFRETHYNAAFRNWKLQCDFDRFRPIHSSIE